MYIARKEAQVMENDSLGHEDEAYQTCAECGGDCEPEPAPTDAGMRIAFSSR